MQELAHQSEQDIAQRIQELNHKLDTEGVLKANAAVLAFTGLLLGLFVNHNWWCTT